MLLGSELAFEAVFDELYFQWCEPLSRKLALRYVRHESVINDVTLMTTMP